MFGTGHEIWIGFLYLAIILIVFAFLRFLAKKHVGFSKRVFISLGLAVILGTIMYFVMLNVAAFNGNTAIAEDWLNLFGNGYVSLLKMIAIPIVFVSIVSAVLKLGSGGEMGKIAGYGIGFLLLTTAIAATVGILVTLGFGIDAGDIVGEEISEDYCQTVIVTDPATGEYDLLDGEYQMVPGADPYMFDACVSGLNKGSKEDSLMTFPDMLASFIPDNILTPFTGQTSNATLKVVIISFAIGMSVLYLRRKKPEQAASFERGFSSVHSVVMRLVTYVLRLTPYGVFALMMKVFAFTGWESMGGLLIFLAASYVAIIIMFIIHAILLTLFGYNPITYFKKSGRTLMFAFTSRSSAGTLPMTIDTQEKAFGVDGAVAATTSSFGTSIGQNGCAGIYPAMLVTMVYATGLIPGLNFGSYLMLIFITTITSLGIAGVGGGATFAAIAVFSALGLDDWMWVTGILIGIEALIDMARTSLNVSGSMTSGLLTAKVTNSVDKEVYNSPISVTETNEFED